MTLQFSAQDAINLVKKASDINSEHLAQETQKILEDIKAAATKGTRFISYDGYMEEIIQKRLRTLGFKVDPSSHYNETVTTVKW